MALTRSIFPIAIIIAMSVNVWAQNPEGKQSKSAQCAQYGSYEDAEGQWNTCEEGSYDSYDFNNYTPPEPQTDYQESYQEEPIQQEEQYQQEIPYQQEEQYQQEEPYQDPNDYPEEPQDEEPRD